MEPTQLTHLREAAADIRRSLNAVTEIHDQLDDDTDDYDRIPLMHRHLQNMERALTRIDMCLKEIK